MARTLRAYLYDKATGKPQQYRDAECFNATTGASVSTATSDVNGLVQFTGLSEFAKYRIAIKVPGDIDVLNELDSAPDSTDVYNVRHFGALGDGTPDDSPEQIAASTAAIQAAFDAYAVAAHDSTTVPNQAHSARVHFPKGYYNINAPIQIPEGVVITGDGVRATQINNTGNGHAFMCHPTQGYSTQNITIRDLTIRGRADATAGSAIYIANVLTDDAVIHSGNCIIENVYIYGGYDGITLCNMWGWSTVRLVRVVGVEHNGIQSLPTLGPIGGQDNGVTLDTCYVSSSGNHGYYLNGGFISLTGCIAEHSVGDAYHFFVNPVGYRTMALSMRGCSAEANYARSFYADRAIGVSLSGCFFTTERANSSHGLELSNCQGVVLDGCYVNVKYGFGICHTSGTGGGTTVISSYIYGVNPSNGWIQPYSNPELITTIGTVQDPSYMVVDNNVALGFDHSHAKLGINGGLHVGGNSDPGDNNLLADGTIEAVGTVTGSQLVSDVAVGTPPLVVTSTTVVPNLHVEYADDAGDADTVDGSHASAFALSGHTHTSLHDRSHSITSTFDHTYGGTPSGSDVDGVLAVSSGTIAMVAPTYNVSSKIPRLLKSGTNGFLALNSLNVGGSDEPSDDSLYCGNSTSGTGTFRHYGNYFGVLGVNATTQRDHYSNAMGTASRTIIDMTSAKITDMADFNVTLWNQLIDDVQRNRDLISAITSDLMAFGFANPS